MPYTIVTIVHILACFFLVLVVLLQTGKGADVGAVFGGSSQTIFGSQGAGDFLTKTTTGIAILFMLTSLFLSYGATQQQTESLFDSVEPISAPAPEEAEAVSEADSSQAGEANQAGEAHETDQTGEESGTGAAVPAPQAAATATEETSQQAETAANQAVPSVETVLESAAEPAPETSPSTVSDPLSAAPAESSAN